MREHQARLVGIDRIVVSPDVWRGLADLVNTPTWVTPAPGDQVLGHRLEVSAALPPGTALAIPEGVSATLWGIDQDGTP